MLSTFLVVCFALAALAITIDYRIPERIRSFIAFAQAMLNLYAGYYRYRLNLKLWRFAQRMTIKCQTQVAAYRYEYYRGNAITTVESNQAQ